jgi:hypothetical protein
VLETWKLGTLFYCVKLTFKMDKVFARLKNFDAYPKTLEDFRVRTFSGAIGRPFYSIKFNHFVYNHACLLIISFYYCRSFHPLALCL